MADIEEEVYRANQKLVNLESTQTKPVLETQSKEEKFEECNTATPMTLLEETLEEKQIIEPSLETQEPGKISEDLVSSI